MAKAKPGAAAKARAKRFTVDHLAKSKFEKRGLRNYFEYRDLGIRRATRGKLVAHVIRARPGKAPHGEWHVHDCRAQFVYVLKGWVRFEYEGVGEVLMKAGSCFYQPPRIRHQRSSTRKTSSCSKWWRRRASGRTPRRNLQPESHRPVVDQPHPHLGAEAARRDRADARAGQRDESPEQALAFGGRRGTGEAGAGALAGVGGKGELRHGKQRASGVGEREVHLPLRVGKDAVAEDALDQALGLRLAVAALDADQGENPAPIAPTDSPPTVTSASDTRRTSAITR